MRLSFGFSPALFLNSVLTFALSGTFLLGISGCEEKAVTPKTSAAAIPKDAAIPVDGRVKITVENEGYNPLAVQVKANQEVVLEFTRVTSSPCGERVMVPDHGIDVELPLNKPVDIRITPTKAGTLAFMCGLKMMKGTLIVQ